MRSCLPNLRQALLAAGLLLAAAPAARAQDIGPVFDMSIIPTNAGLQTVEMTERKRAGLPDKYVGKSTAPATRASFAYVPTAALQKQTAAAYVAKLRATDPAAATTMATGLAGKANYPALYHELNDGTGLPENDAAAVMANYLLLNWAIVNDVHDEQAITPARSQAVRQQAARLLAGNPKLAAPAAKAQFGEQLKLNTALLKVGWLRAQHDGTAAAFRQKTAGQLQRQFHLDMSQLQLTAQGLAKK